MITAEMLDNIRYLLREVHDGKLIDAIVDYTNDDEMVDKAVMDAMEFGRQNQGVITKRHLVAFVQIGLHTTLKAILAKHPLPVEQPTQTTPPAS